MVGASGAHSQVGTDAHFNVGVFRGGNFLPRLKFGGEQEWRGAGMQRRSKGLCNKEMGRGSKRTAVANLSTLQ